MPPAEIIPFGTKGPTADGASPEDTMALLRFIAGRAWEAGADPSALVSADYKLLILCDDVIMLKRQADTAWEDWCRAGHGDLKSQEAWVRAKRAVRAPVVELGKHRATTPVGIFAKAIVARAVGPGAAKLAVSLAEDLLRCPELRAAIWPMAAQTPPQGLVPHPEP